MGIMAEAAPKQSESMEDILQSIKRIIEDDGDTGAKPAAPAPVAHATDVLDLTQILKEDGTLASISPLPSAAAPAPKPEPEKPAIKEPEPAPAPAPTPQPVPKTLTLEDALVSDQAAQAASAALRPITHGTQKDYSIPHIPSSALRNGNTVEDLVLESLKPMLKAWLDEHLPLIVQKIVEKEVKRIVTFHQD